MLRVVIALLVVVCLVACGGHEAPSGGVSQDEAIAAASAQFPDATGVVSAKAGPMRDFDTSQQVVSGDRWVWAIVVSGTFPLSCGPTPLPSQSPAPCPPPAKTQTVVLDYETGSFLEAFSQSGQ